MSDKTIHANPGSKSRSRVWLYFGFVKIDDDGPPSKNNLDPTRAVCRLCKKSYVNKDEENHGIEGSPSPHKKKKETRASRQRQGETPVRSSLAAKLAQFNVNDDDKNEKEVVTVPVLSVKASVKQNLLTSPVKSPMKQNLLNSPVKLPMNPNLLQSPVKLPMNPNLLQSPVKSPMRPNLLQSPVKSPMKPNLLSSPVRGSPNKSLSFRRLLETSPTKRSPNKTLSVKPVLDRSPVKRHVMKLHRADNEAYNQAKQSFHTSKPERLIGRDKEIAEIHGFLKCHMTSKTAGSLYISGAPGTGKTAVLAHIIDELKDVHSCKRLYLNCMTLDNSHAVYGKVYTDLTGKNAPTAKERQRAVEKELTRDGPSVIMVLDEIDQLDSKNQEILYTIFEWPSLYKSRLILVGIANALDLTDRILPRLQARPNCKPRLLNFAPYSKDQIAAIIRDRLKDLETEGMSVMDPTAIQFCARKISAVAGDMRKALDVCRRAVEMVETDVRSQRVLKSTASACNSPVKQSPAVPKKIGVLHINSVLSDVYGSSTTAQQQETIPLQQKLLVCSLLLMLKQGKMKEVPAGKLHDVYSKVCRKRQMASVDQSEFQGIMTLLESRGILGIKKAKETRLAKVTLKLDEHELEHTMQDKVLISAILQDGIPK